MNQAQEKLTGLLRQMGVLHNELQFTEDLILDFKQASNRNRVAQQETGEAYNIAVKLYGANNLNTGELDYLHSMEKEIIVACDGNFLINDATVKTIIENHRRKILEPEGITW